MRIKRFKKSKYHEKLKSKGRDVEFLALANEYNTAVMKGRTNAWNDNPRAILNLEDKIAAIADDIGMNLGKPNARKGGLYTQIYDLKVGVKSSTPKYKDEHNRKNREKRDKRRQA